MERESGTYTRPQPLIAVRNVRASSQWYRHLQRAEALSEHQHRDIYDRIHYDGQLILQLHAWDEDNHPNLVNPDSVRVGHGVVLWFEVNEFAAAVGRARSLGAEIAEEPHVSVQAQHKEISIRDPDGYMVVLAGPDGET